MRLIWRVGSGNCNGSCRQASIAPDVSWKDEDREVRCV